MTRAEITGSRYVFDNDSQYSGEQHSCLTTAYDGMTTRRLAATGVSGGWTCWDVGTGGGSIARWLADNTAPAGSVLATDVKPIMIGDRPNLVVAPHDLTTDPLPEQRFDLIVARLLLQHLPRRDDLVARLAAALAPGGWLQIDEFDTSYAPVLLAPTEADAKLYEKFLDTKTRLIRGNGGDPEWGRRAAHAMRTAGLVDIDPQPHLGTRHADSPELQLQLHHTYHLRDGLLAAGMTDTELDRVRMVMRDPSFRASSSPMYSVQGRKDPQR